MPQATTGEAPSGDTVLRGLVAVLVVVFVVASLRAADTVFLPLAYAVFLIGLFWPLQKRLSGRMPRWGATLVTLGVFLLVTWLFGWALWESVEAVAERAPQYEDELSGIVEGARTWVTDQGVPWPFDGEGSGGAGDGGTGAEERARDWLVRTGRVLFDLAGASVLVIAYFTLGLLEVKDFKVKLDAATEERRHQNWREPVRRIAHDFQRYMVVRTGVGLLTGVGSFLAALLVGLDFALLWGVLNFLLNYIPTLGSILGVIPPVLFGLVQGGWTMGLLALVAVGGVQVVMGAFVDPRVQGRYLRLSPLVVLFSVAFWEWVWGIPGAFIGVPVTVGLVIAAARFSSTHWIAVLLSDVDAEGRITAGESARSDG